MNTKVRLTLFTLIAISLAVASYGAIHKPAPLDQNLEPRGFNLNTPAPELVTGFLVTKEGQVNFESSMLGDDVVLLEVRTLPLVVSANLEISSGVLEISSQQPILPVDQEMLTELALRLEDELKPYDRDLPIHQDVLVNLVNMLAEAPAGFVFGNLEINISESVDPDAAPEPQTQDLFGPSKVYASAGCYLSDNDSARLRGCQYRKYVLCHDANGGGHCFDCYIRYAGCKKSAGCKGRCGPGCGSSGKGKYYYDCAEHDDCCRAHGGCTNPAAIACGDEYRDAAGDYFASTNCTKGC